MTPASAIRHRPGLLFIVSGPGLGALKQGTLPPADPARSNETMKSVFRVYTYAPSYAACTGRTLTPGNVGEVYWTRRACAGGLGEAAPT